MIKAILIDADGVVLKPAKKIFSQRLKEEYGIEIPLSFWKEVYPKVRLGQTSLKKELVRRIKKWGWQKSVESFLEYWWEPQNKINLPVLKLLKKIRTKGIKLYLASDNNQYRADHLMEKVLGQYFDGAFFSCSLDCVKEDNEFYQAVFKKTGLKPTEILFVDDEKENVDAAKKAGLKVLFYQDFDRLKTLLNSEAKSFYGG